jgi:hypothetical protein
MSVGERELQIASLAFLALSFVFGVVIGDGAFFAAFFISANVCRVGFRILEGLRK